MSGIQVSDSAVIVSILAVAIVRLAVVSISGALAYFAFKLFAIGLSTHDRSSSLSDKPSELDVKHGSTQLTFKSAAPGLYFALFSAAVMTVALINPVSITFKNEPASQKPSARSDKTGAPQKSVLRDSKATTGTRAKTAGQVVKIRKPAVRDTKIGPANIKDGLLKFLEDDAPAKNVSPHGFDTDGTFTFHIQGRVMPDIFSPTKSMRRKGELGEILSAKGNTEYLNPRFSSTRSED